MDTGHVEPDPSPRPESGDGAQGAALHNKQTLTLLFQTLELPNTTENRQKILQILKNNPSLMTDFIKQRKLYQQSQTGAAFQALQHLLHTLKSPNTPENQQQVLQILKSNPRLMAALVKQRQLYQQLQTAQAQNQAAGGGSGGGMLPSQPQPPPQHQLQHMMSQQQQQQDFDLCVQCCEKDGLAQMMEKLVLDLDDGSSSSDQKQANPQNLCEQCKEKNGLPQEMEELGLDLGDGFSSDQKQANPQEAKKLAIQRCIGTLVHVCQNKDVNCHRLACQKMKRVVQHTKICKRKTNGGCPICKQLIALCCYHAKHCQETKCPVPYCLNIKHTMKQPQLQKKLQQRRMAMMNARANATSGPLPGNSAAGALVSGAVSPAGVMGGPGAGAGMVVGIPSHQPGTQTPPANVFQVVKQEQMEQ